MNQDIIENFKQHLALRESGNGFEEDEHPAQVFKEYLIQKIEKTLCQYRVDRLQSLEDRIQSQYPDYVLLKNLSEAEEGGDKNFVELTDDQKEQLEVVDINFCFDQHKIIHLLEKRAPIFDRLDADETKALEDLEKIDDEINQNISSFFDKCNNDEFENLNKITSFYVTFKTELA